MKKCLNSVWLKNIAYGTMLIDHIAASLYPYMDFSYDLYLAMRAVGRLGFPIFCFFLVEGFHKTSNRMGYLIRMAVFALISEIPFDLAMNGAVLEFSSQNVGFTLLIGLLMMLTFNWLKQFEGVVGYLGQALSLVAFMFLADWLATDYAGGGILLIGLMYWLRSQEQLLAAGIFFGIYYIAINSSMIECYGWVVILLFALYNGQRGRINKWLEYSFYPAHLLILGLIIQFVIF